MLPLPQFLTKQKVANDINNLNVDSEIYSMPRWGMIERKSACSVLALSYGSTPDRYAKRLNAWADEGVVNYHNRKHGYLDISEATFLMVLQAMRECFFASSAYRKELRRICFEWPEDAINRVEGQTPLEAAMWAIHADENVKWHLGVMIHADTQNQTKIVEGGVMKAGEVIESKVDLSNPYMQRLAMMQFPLEDIIGYLPEFLTRERAMTAKPVN